MELITNKPILVTGGTGYIASWIINLLLQKGYSVNTTVRDVGNFEKNLHLKEIAIKNKGNIHFFKADLLDPNSFDAPMKEVEYVIHTASPFIVQNINDPKKDLIEPALNGTTSILQAINKHSSIKKLVLTSSASAIHGDNSELQKTKDNKFTEDYWNTTSTENYNPYQYSKTIAEKKAWEIANQQTQWDLAVINPTFVLGPSLSKRTDSTSIQTILQLCNGTFRLGTPNITLGITDVRDVAEAHIEALFNPNAKGRFIICNESLTMLQISKIIEQEFPSKFALPTFELPYFLVWIFGPLLNFSHRYIENNLNFPVYYDNSRSKTILGLNYKQCSITIIDQVKQLLNDNLLK